MAIPKKPGKKITPQVFERKRERRRRERKPPEGVSLRQWRKQKAKCGIPIVSRKQLPLETVAEARRQIAAIPKVAQGGAERFRALTNLMSRAFTGKRNKRVIQLIEAERAKIKFNLAAEEKFIGQRAKFGRGHGFALSDGTLAVWDRLKRKMRKQNFGECNQLIGFLVASVPKKESGMVAGLLETFARDSEIRLLRGSGPAKNKEFTETIVRAYAAAGEFYSKRNIWDKAEELFTAADILKARMAA